MRKAALVAGLLALAVYANSLGNGFAYDDVHIILENTDLQSLETLPGAVFKPYCMGTMKKCSSGCGGLQRRWFSGWSMPSQGRTHFCTTP